MHFEEKRLRQQGVTDAYERTYIDHRALIITPYHKAINRLREIARGDERHGSCGEGIGETMADQLQYGKEMLFVGDLLAPQRARKKLDFIRMLQLAQLAKLQPLLPESDLVSQEIQLLTDESLPEQLMEYYQYFTHLVRIVDEDYLSQLLEDGVALLEGAQGVLIDEVYGSHPYTTWSTTSTHNADTLLSEIAYSGEIERLGLLRAYATRHGPGPFVTEDRSLTTLLPDAHNGENTWQRAFRVGYFDLLAARYALAVCGNIDALAITNIDRLVEVPVWQTCTGYVNRESGVNLAEYFEMEDGRLTDIRVSKKPDLVYQAELTRLLMGCLPIYQKFYRACGPIESVAGDYLSYIEQELGRPIAIASYGPTAEAKYHLKSAHNHVLSSQAI
jgi:adenylosuccinate synthase